MTFLCTYSIDNKISIKECTLCVFVWCCICWGRADGDGGDGEIRWGEGENVKWMSFELVLWDFTEHFLSPSLSSMVSTAIIMNGCSCTICPSTGVLLSQSGFLYISPSHSPHSPPVKTHLNEEHIMGPLGRPSPPPFIPSPGISVFQFQPLLLPPPPPLSLYQEPSCSL